MTRLLYLLLIFSSLGALGQSSGNTLLPTTKFQAYNRSLMSSGQRSLDGKYKYTDTVHFWERAFVSIAEANAYIPLAQRTSGVTVQINTGGTIDGNGHIVGGTNEDYQYKNGPLSTDLVLKVAITGVFEPNVNGNVTLPAYAGAGERLVSFTSGGMFNTITLLPATARVTTQALTDSSTLPASTAYVKASLASSQDTTTVSSVGGGVQVIKSVVNIPSKAWTFRSFVDGTNSTVRLVGTDGIAIDVAPGGGINPAANIDWTGLHTFTNTGTPVTVTRLAVGPILHMVGPSATTIDLGTHPFYGFGVLSFSGRGDISAGTGSDLHFFATNVFQSGNNIMTTKAIATSTATQSSAWATALEVSTWTGSASFSVYSGWRSYANPSINGRVWTELRVGSNNDLATGVTVIGATEDGTLYLPHLNRGGTEDSTLKIDALGVVTKYAPAHSRAGTPTFNITSGAGTSPAITVTGNDMGGLIAITTGASGSFGILTGTLTFSTTYGANVKVVVSGKSIEAGRAIPLAIGLSSSCILGTVNPLVASTPYEIYYIIEP